MRKITFLFIVFFFPVDCFTQSNYAISFDENENISSTYFEAIEHYQELAANLPTVKISTYGNTDAGQPLHLVIFSQDQQFDSKSILKENKVVVLINNAIHAGESCGVDASMDLMRDLALHPEQFPDLENVVILVIPVYNIGGALNRNSHTRTNQNGPEEYGFRGNAKNLDLNRDFIKCDSENAQTFNKLFTEWEPDIFIDNHTSNGADYQYTITLIATQAEKLGGPLASFQKQKMLPELYAKMRRKNWEMIPYVFSRGLPDRGIAGFLDLPRYSSGYAALHHSLSFTVETHMLKPFADRVKSTRAFSESIIEFAANNSDKIKAAKKASIEQYQNSNSYDINWTLDSTRKDSLLFKGYTASQKASLISGHDRLYYEQSKPYEKYIPFLNSYRANKSIQIPKYYIIPQAYKNVIARLKWNGVEMKRLESDSTFNVNLYRLVNYSSPLKPYESHFLHSDVEVVSEKTLRTYSKGDFLINTNQKAIRYLMETLEPEAPDSFFAWNFFDGILSQKEYFSSYVFEDRAVEILNNNPRLKKELEEARAKDPNLAKDGYAQLKFIYDRSVHKEPTVNLYPVGRIE